MPEAYIAVGKVALTEYGTPSTDELEASIRPAAKEHDAILLANHGAGTGAIAEEMLPVSLSASRRASSSVSS